MDKLRIKRLEDAVLELAKIINELSLGAYDPNSEFLVRAFYRGDTFIESCDNCGTEQPLIWTAPDELWKEVTGILDGSGIYCPKCFDELAQKNNIFIRWIPTKEVKEL